MNQTSPLLLSDLAARIDGQLVGDGQTAIARPADVADAAPDSIVFAESAKMLQTALDSAAAAVITTPALAGEGSAFAKPLVLVASPRLAFAGVLDAFAMPWMQAGGVHATAVVAPDADISPTASIGPQVWIDAGVTIGNYVSIMAGAKIGANCKIGDGTIVYPNVVLYPRVTVGRGCLLHAGCVLGADGFGYEATERGARKLAHIGTVELGDGVEVGANTCIDRAKTGKTVIGSGTKLDNLVHIAHNVQIGQATLIVAQAGVAGSVRIGNGVILAGQAGIKDHVTIGDGAQVGAQGGVIGDVAPGAKVSGYPAREHRAKMREYAALSFLPAYAKRLRDLERRLDELEGKTENVTR